ncbi:MAG: SUF system Fe-S cluster assembly protein [Bacteroidales bacterium]|nr:SUF system Fe-S cluster assembly protein [Bacteroidales bacterium]MCF8386708.1 SUF system Fe-S cluster assembly protein [Bacteroidales bacterium]MCF8397219.1 SUF system Fe-S cluster assembly protein [Bacteroidales bacterium]
MSTTDKKELEKQIIHVLKNIYDPEIPVNIYEIGLIYEIKIDDENKVNILMTLTSPNCPVAESLPQEVQDKVGELNAVKKSRVELTFDPPWTMDMLSEEAKLELGFM